jgi:hypothetical protein
MGGVTKYSADGGYFFFFFFLAYLFSISVLCVLLLDVCKDCYGFKTKHIQDELKEEGRKKKLHAKQGLFKQQTLNRLNTNTAHHI